MFEPRYWEIIKEWVKSYDKDAISMTQEEFDEIYDDVYFDGLLASENILAKDWDTSEEDEAWKDL